MESEERGYLEKFLDRRLSEDRLSKTIERIAEMLTEGFITNIEDTAFGYIVGTTLMNANTVLGERGFDLNEEQIKKVSQEFWDMIERRGHEIKSRIREVANM